MLLKKLNRLKNKKGFTMIELLVAVAVFGILIAVMSVIIRPVNTIIMGTRSDTRVDAVVDNIGDYIKRSTDIASRVDIMRWPAFTGTGFPNFANDEADRYLENFLHCQAHAQIFEQHKCATAACLPTCFLSTHGGCIPWADCGFVDCDPGGCPNNSSHIFCLPLCTEHIGCVSACTLTTPFTNFEYRLFALYFDENGRLYDFGDVTDIAITSTGAGDHTALVSHILNPAARNAAQVFIPDYYSVLLCVRGVAVCTVDNPCDPVITPAGSTGGCGIDYEFEKTPAGGLKVSASAVRNGRLITRGEAGGRLGRVTTFNFPSPFMKAPRVDNDANISETRNFFYRRHAEIPRPPEPVIILYTKRID